MAGACRKIRTKLLIVLGILPLCWVGLVFLLPTTPLRIQIEKLLSERSNQPVHIASVQISILGQLSAMGVRLGDPASPWLQIERISAPLDGLGILHGNFWPTQCQVDGLQIDAVRNSAGEWNVVLQSDEPQKERVASKGLHDGQSESQTRNIEIVIRSGRITAEDESSEHKLTVTGLSGQAAWEPGSIFIEHINGQISDGQISLAARFSQESHNQLAVEGTMKLREMRLAQENWGMAYFVPMVAQQTGDVSGRLNGEFIFRSRGDSPAQLTDSLEGTLELRLDELQLDRSAFFEALSQALQVPARARLGSAQGSFNIRNQQVSTQNLVVLSGGTSIRMSGSTDFSGNVDYKIDPGAMAAKISGLADRLPPEAKRLTKELNLTGELNRLAELRLLGRIDNLRLETAGVGLNQIISQSGLKNLKMDRDQPAKSLRDLGNRQGARVRR